jgi:redox-sensitive bicupin YhaK (pirin superfamily)
MKRLYDDNECNYKQIRKDRMLTVRKSEDRGYAELGWLKSWHTFSFAEYYDKRFMNFGHLRVINDDIIAPARGFPTHPHRDMEIISYVLEGALEHKDSMGNGSVMRPGEVQRMSAGTGVAHSEFNPSATKFTRLLQIWIMPDRQGYESGYEQTEFPESEKRGKFRLVASNDGREGSVRINQDVKMYAAMFDGDETSTFEMPANRKAWIQIAKGSVSLNGQRLQEGDGVAVVDEQYLVCNDGAACELLLFEMSSEA